jgi:hypothetical protein
MKGIIIKKNSKNKVHCDAISRKLKAKKDAYNTGIKIARRWIQNASYQEIIDVLPRTNLHHDTNYFALMRNIFFISIEKRYPNETEDFRWFNTVDFMRGWREEVISMWKNDNRSQ